VPFAFDDYLDLADRTGQALRADKRGYIETQEPKILDGERERKEKGHPSCLGRRARRAQQHQGPHRRSRRLPTSIPGIFVACDMRRSRSLVVRAIRKGRQCARAVDEWLMGKSGLPR